MDSASAYIHTGGTAPAEQVSLSTGKITYLSADTLGSVRGIISPAGTLTATTSYDTWGNPKTPGGLTSYTPFGYAGGYTDPTGLIYLINRYYDPATGQFLSVDPDVSQTGQPYAYAGDDPVNNTDPLGLRVGWWFILVTSQGPFASEADFENNFVLPLVGGFNQFWIARSTEPQNMYRVVDIYNQQFSWIHELKVGSQELSSRNRQQIFRDRAIISTQGRGFCNHVKNFPPPGYHCHPMGATGDKVAGGTWWFGPRAGQACQIVVIGSTGPPCPAEELGAWLNGFYWPSRKSSGQIPLNFVMVWNDIEYPGQVPVSVRARVRALVEQQNTCPLRDLYHLIPAMTWPRGRLSGQCFG
jgi:RHS repeat-associated protein